jgi:hypothetical protein
MEFRLKYNGRLKSRSSATTRDKHEIRKKLHPQLRALWSREPLTDMPAHLTEIGPNARYANLSLAERVGAFTFIPLVSRRWFTIAELDVLFLRRSPPGELIKHGGDIDNRMKTLFDALRVPKADELPDGATAGEDEEPFYCLLQDDALVTALSVRTDQLLEPGDLSNVLLILHVNVKLTRPMLDYMGL